MKKGAPSAIWHRAISLDQKLQMIVETNRYLKENNQVIGYLCGPRNFNDLFDKRRFIPITTLIKRFLVIIFGVSANTRPTDFAASMSGDLTFSSWSLWQSHYYKYGSYTLFYA